MQKFGPISIRNLTVVVSAISLVAAAGLAQDVEGESEPESEDICIAGPRWRPLLSDVARIETEPVPASLRSLSGERCVEMMRNEVHLIDWHLAFGSERSATSALQYVADHYLEGDPRPEAFVGEIRRAWRAAQPDLRRAATLEQPTGVNYSVRHRFLSQSRTYRRLESLEEARDDYILVAEQYLRAAEEFGSRALLSRAEAYLQPALDASGAFPPAETEARTYFGLEGGTFRTDDLRMRIAVLRAQITRAPADLGRAETALGEVHRPLFLEAAQHAYEAGNDFCDFERTERRAAVNHACHNEDAFSDLVINYWINRAILDLVSDSAETREELTLRLLQRERLSSGVERYGGRKADDDMRRILLARAALRTRDFAVKIAEPDPHDARMPWAMALGDLEQAERLTDPFEQPRRFRLIAEAWLALYAHANALDSPEDPHTPRSASPARQRYATYLRRLLVDLEAIAVGADGAPR